jgi:hypothetical protein
MKEEKSLFCIKFGHVSIYTKQYNVANIYIKLQHKYSMSLEKTIQGYEERTYTLKLRYNR